MRVVVSWGFPNCTIAGESVNPQERQMQKLTIALGVWAAVGPMVGILVGHFLTRSWQQKQWLMDRRHEEFQELISALDASMTSEVGHADYSMELTPQERRDKARRTSDFFTVLRTRIFIVDDIKRLDLNRRWTKAFAQYRKENDTLLFHETYLELIQQLVDAATKA
jgi:hypothetical protein